MLHKLYYTIIYWISGSDERVLMVIIFLIFMNRNFFGFRFCFSTQKSIFILCFTKYFALNLFCYKLITQTKRQTLPKIKMTVGEKQTFRRTMLANQAENRNRLRQFYGILVCSGEVLSGFEVGTHFSPPVMNSWHLKMMTPEKKKLRYRVFLYHQKCSKI